MLCRRRWWESCRELSLTDRIPPAEAGGSFLSDLQKSRLCGERIPPTAVGGSFNSSLPSLSQECLHQRGSELAAGPSVS
jgi:hypothetical protein